MTQKELLNRVIVKPGVCGGHPCIKGTRIDIAIILDALAEGATADQVIDHYPQLRPEDIHAALAYAAALAKENLWKVAAAS
ncbi:MAG: DUF433 domain-containing protein [Deltaproteobacteria bacterium]|nr:DUF433 domain-containing protein [Deltaproteobacteria bacterium]